MSAATESLIPASASKLARSSPVRFPGESVAYRKARTELLAEEIDLRRRIERVAELRRALPPGGEVPEDYVFQGVDGPVKFSELFGRHPRSLPTTGCSARSASGRAPCAPRC
jgi:hypothetical protein